MTHTSTEQERADFKTWAEPEGYNVSEHPLAQGCQFVCEATNRAYSVWQAARRAPAVPVETLETEYASCLAQCRDAFPVPDVNTELEGLWVAAMGCPLSVPEYIKAIAAAPQPPEADHIPDAGKMVAVPVQMPGPVAWQSVSNGSPINCAAFRKPKPKDGKYLPLYTDQQVRDLLAAHGIKVAP